MQMTERDIREDLTGLTLSCKVKPKNRLKIKRLNYYFSYGAYVQRSYCWAHHNVRQVRRRGNEGPIIGKEGRNIQALQRATGVDIMVDDTPGYIVLSSFDPVRREVARQALEMLIKDGRFIPANWRVVEKAQQNVEKDVIHAGEDAAREVGIIGIPKEVLHLLGELKYRTSYGQNVLKHSTEMAHLAGMMLKKLVPM